MTYLLVSPTRSSIAGYALRSDVDGIVRWHNGEESSEHPKPPAETELLRHESGCLCSLNFRGPNLYRSIQYSMIILVGVYILRYLYI